MKPANALLTVIEVATRKRDEALQQLAQARREQEHALLQMSQLQGYTVESQQRWSARASTGVSVALLHAHQNMMAKLAHAVQFQQGVLQRLAQHVERCEQSVLQAERELASLKKFQHRQQAAWQQHQQRTEQKLNDEMAAAQHRQHAHHTPWRPTP